MKFGIFYEMQLPKPWGPTSERDIFQQSLDQVELADELGYDYVWEVEHHFLEEYSHSSAPEIFLAAASQRTRQIRLGHGIVLMPPAYNHPARIGRAHRDARPRLERPRRLRYRRVVFGDGDGRLRREPRREARAVGRVAPALASSGCSATSRGSITGKYVDFPKRNVIPKPVQKPHPPLWVACSNPDTVYMAAKRGLGTLGFDFSGPEETSQASRRVLPHHPRGVRPDRRRDQRAVRRRQRLHVLPARRRGR